MLDLIKTRRSVREFKDKPVEEAHIESILEAARWAPSAGNVQPWHFIVVKDSEVRSALARAALGQTFIAQAPLVIVVIANLQEAEASYGSRGAEMYCLQDTAAATQNMLLTAHWLGLAACWVGAFNDSMVSNVLNLQRHLRPVAIVPIGYPAEQPSPPFRRQQKEVTSFM